MKFRTSAPAARSTAVTTRRGSRFAARAFVTTGAAAMFIGIAGVPAFAAPGISDSGTAEANVEVESAISLTMDKAAFTLTGVPATTQSENGAVTYNVETNNAIGYSVTVQAATATMAGTGTNADTIPSTALTVRKTGTTPFTALSYVGQTGAGSAAVPVHSQATRSAAGGDDLSTDYEILIPFVNEDTYTATLNYVATTL
jgi:hypothetical protein